MSVVTRLAGWILLAGLAAGLVLRLVAGRRRFADLLSGALLVPWMLHAGYVSERALAHRFSVWGVVAFVLGGALLAGAAVVAGRRLVTEHGLVAALLPAALGLVYGLGPVLLVSFALRRSGVDLDVVPTAAYVGACLFATAALLPFAPRGWRPGGGTAGRRGPWNRR